MNNVLERIIEYYSEEEFLKAENFDDVIIGIDESSMRLIYSVKKCIKILMKDMSYEEAVEYFNVSGSYVGDKTPIWCYDNF